MPVRYDIAAQVPQAATGGMDPLNAFATMQAMSYRQQQNALAQLQEEKLRRELQMQNVLSSMDITSPGAVKTLSQAGYLPEALSVMGSQRSAARERAIEEAQSAQAEETRKRTNLLMRKYEEVEMPKAFADLEKLRNENKIGQQDYLTKKAGFYRDYLKDFVTNQSTLDRLVDLMDQDKDFPAGGSAFRDVKFTPEWKASQLIPPEKQAELAKPKFRYQQITDAAGNTRVVAIPESAPERGAIEVPGTVGAAQDRYTAMPGPSPEFITRFNPRTGEAELTTPRQPGANVMAAPAAPTNAMVAPPQTAPAAAPVQGRMIPAEIRPTAEAPVGSAAYNNKRFATEVLDAAGFNAETGKDEVSELIRGSVSGGMETAAAGIRGFFGTAPKGMENIAKLETIKNDIVLKKLGGKLGAGISEGDRQFIEKLTGDIANPNIPANQRLAAWNQIKGLMVKYANTGQPMTAPAGAPAGRPSLDEIFK